MELAIVDQSLKVWGSRFWVRVSGYREIWMKLFLDEIVVDEIVLFLG